MPHYPRRLVKVEISLHRGTRMVSCLWCDPCAAHVQCECTTVCDVRRLEGGSFTIDNLGSATRIDPWSPSVRYSHAKYELTSPPGTRILLSHTPHCLCMALALCPFLQSSGHPLLPRDGFLLPCTSLQFCLPWTQLRCVLSHHIFFNQFLYFIHHLYSSYHLLVVLILYI